MTSIRSVQALTFSKTCDAINALLIVLDSGLRIKYFNKYVEAALGWKNKKEILEYPFVKIWKECHFPSLLNQNGQLSSRKPMLINGHKIQWQQLQEIGQGEAEIFLIGQDIDKSDRLYTYLRDLTIEVKGQEFQYEEMYQALENVSREVTGQESKQRLSPYQYISQVRYYLENVIAKMPCYVYWKDTNLRYLGCNELVCEELGFKSRHEFIGKTDYDFGWDTKIVNNYVKIDKEIIATGKPKLNLEEKIANKKGKEILLLTNKLPLFDNNKKVIGIIGIGVDITKRKRRENKLSLSVKELSSDIDIKKFEQEEIFQSLENISQEIMGKVIAERLSAQQYVTKIRRYFEGIINKMPCYVYWKDINFRYIGCNDLSLSLVGVKSKDEFIGKTNYDFGWDPKLVDEYQKIDEEIIKTRQPKLNVEEMVIDKNGQKLHLLVNKLPLIDDNDEVIGVIGISVDITERKRMEEELNEVERLKVEHEVQKKLALEQEKFVKAANQVAHDIRSPLASLLMIVKSCKEIPEADRIALREASMGISDIANNLLSRYQEKEPDSEVQEKQSILVSTVLMQILTEKKFQYQNLPVKFDCNFNPYSYFSFIKIAPSALKRMLSNLINNAVDAFEKKPGKVDLNVESNPEWVKISIQDNGKGMPKEIVNKILQNIAVTAGKESGHGIGLTQVREALQNNQGEMAIDSKLGEGTKITLTFPRIKTPNWIAEEIALGKEDVIVILDDDTSIHGAWDAHFEPLLQEASALQVKHFKMGREALTYMRGLSEEQKKKVFLLTDYELLKQELNGLHVVAQSGVRRSILVTSYYADLLIQNQAAKTGTKILPKQLASEVAIKIIEVVETQVQDQALKPVDLVIIDDDEKFVKTLVEYAFDGKAADEYYDPDHFLSNASKYAKDTAICLDNNFAKSSVRGLDVAKLLHEQGFTRIYILSGEEFDKNKLPAYVTVIRKDDIDRLQEI